VKTAYIHNGKGTARAYLFGRLDLLDFVKQVFDAVELERNQLPNGFHVQAQIGDSVVVLSAMDPPYAEATKGSVYVYVEDVDATYKRVIAAGATSLNSPSDKPWHGRSAGVKDSFGNVWYIETYKGPSRELAARYRLA
jgi:PhnB protein